MKNLAKAAAASLAGLALLAGAAFSQSPFPATRLAATHNSYAGGERGSIEEQLASGVRFVEFDINLGDYPAHGDYQLGHGTAGRQVDHRAPNPGSTDLAAWLRVLANWSERNPGHAPIVLGLDAKDDLSRPASPSEGNLSALNAELRQHLGARLFTAEELGTAAWPTAGELANRILVVLSGNEETRKRYRSEQGQSPAVAINAAGQAIVVYQSAEGSALGYWYGTAAAGGGMEWPIHGRYDSGSAPAVAIGETGALVEVHQSRDGGELAGRVGVAGKNEVPWGPSQKLGATGTDSAGAAQTLLYSTPRVSRARIAYPQVMFTEFQKGDSSQLANDGLSFYACSSSRGNWSWSGQQQEAGRIVRLWGFAQSDAAVSSPPNFAATDTPRAGWYRQYCAAVSCRQ